MERIRVVPVYKLTQCLVRSVIFSKPEASVTSPFYNDVFYTVVVSRRTRKEKYSNQLYISHAAQHCCIVTRVDYQQ